MSDKPGVPFIAVGNDELGAKIGKICPCHVCGKRHRVHNWEGHLQTIKCGDNHYLVGIDGKVYLSAANPDSGVLDLDADS